MSRSAKTVDGPARAERGPGNAYDEIESEFLGIWLGLARLREKVRLLTAREAPASHAPRRPA
jgi:hypothetical protein